MSNLNLSDLPLIVHTIEHLKTLDPEYYDCLKNDLSDLFSRFDDKTKIDLIVHLIDTLNVNVIAETTDILELFPIYHYNLIVSCCTELEYEYIFDFCITYSNLINDKQAVLFIFDNPDLFDNPELYDTLKFLFREEFELMKHKILPTPQDIKLFKLIHSLLSKAEFNFLCNFYKQHSSLSSEVKEKLLQDENPELYDKLIKIGGNKNGSTTV